MPSAGIMASAVVASVGVDVLSEPFDNFTDNAWALAGAPTIVAGRTGTAAQLVNSTGNVIRYTVPVDGRSDDVTIGFAFQAKGTGTNRRTIVELWGDNNTVRHVGVYRDNDGSLLVLRNGVTTIGTAAAATPLLNTWYYIEFRARIHDTEGIAVVRVDGSTVIDLSGVDTRNVGTNLDIDRVQLGPPAPTNTQLYDDLYLSIDGAAFKGDHAIT